MTVYVDDASIAATAGPRASRWPLLAGTRAELHDFAGALGLRREWFQDPPATWHYDLTEGKCARALQLGAAQRQSLREQITARLEAAGIGPDDPGLRLRARRNAGLGTGPATRSRLREAGREAETR